MVREHLDDQKRQIAIFGYLQIANASANRR